MDVKAFWYDETRKNVCGMRIRELRKQQRLTQKQLSIKAQLAGYDFITETAIIKLERGTRFIPDYEVSIFTQLLGTTTDDLLQIKECQERNSTLPHYSFFHFVLLFSREYSKVP